MSLHTLDVIGVEVAVLCFISLAGLAVMNEIGTAADSVVRLSFRVAGAVLSVALVGLVAATLLKG